MKENITVLNLAKRRKSIRKYSREPVNINDILYAISTALQAPSGANRQPWRFILVTDENVKKKLREVCERGGKKILLTIRGSFI